jgi:hypothetical protein
MPGSREGLKRQAMGLQIRRRAGRFDDANIAAMAVKSLGGGHPIIKDGWLCPEAP